MFSESMPFGETFPILYEWSPNSGKFCRERATTRSPFGEHQVATIICYEDIIPGFVNRIVNNGDPDLIVNLTNDAWFGDTTEPWIHLALVEAARRRAPALLRALDQQRGERDHRSRRARRRARRDVQGGRRFAGEIAWLHGTTVYEVLGDIPWWLVSLLSRRVGVRAPAPTSDPDPFRCRPRGRFRRY